MDKRYEFASAQAKAIIKLQDKKKFLNKTEALVYDLEKQLLPIKKELLDLKIHDSIEIMDPSRKERYINIDQRIFNIEEKTFNIKKELQRERIKIQHLEEECSLNANVEFKIPNDYNIIKKNVHELDFSINLLKSSIKTNIKHYEHKSKIIRSSRKTNADPGTSPSEMIPSQQSPIIVNPAPPQESNEPITENSSTNNFIKQSKEGIADD